MPKTNDILRTYEDLAFLNDRQGQVKLRDHFLVLAADAAASIGRNDEAERLRVQLLSFNPHHLLRPFVSFSEALRSPDIRSYISDLRRTYPPEVAEQMMQQHRPETHAPGEAEPSYTYPASAGTPGHRGNGMDETPAPYRMAPQVSKPASASAAAPFTGRPQKLVPSTPIASVRSSRPSAPMANDWRDRANKPKRRQTAAPNSAAPFDEEPSTASRWFAAFLFFVMLLMGLSLAVLSLLKPFVPEEWLL